MFGGGGPGVEVAVHKLDGVVVASVSDKERDGGWTQTVVLPDGALVYLAAVLRYLTEETLELSANATAHDNGKSIINRRHIMLAWRNDGPEDALAFYQMLAAVIDSTQSYDSGSAGGGSEEVHTTTSNSVLPLLVSTSDAWQLAQRAGITALDAGPVAVELMAMATGMMRAVLGQAAALATDTNTVAVADAVEDTGVSIVRAHMVSAIRATLGVSLYGGEREKEEEQDGEEEQEEEEQLEGEEEQQEEEEAWTLASQRKSPVVESVKDMVGSLGRLDTLNLQRVEAAQRETCLILEAGHFQIMVGELLGNIQQERLQVPTPLLCSPAAVHALQVVVESVLICCLEPSLLLAIHTAHAEGNTPLPGAVVRACTFGMLRKCSRQCR